MKTLWNSSIDKDFREEHQISNDFYYHHDLDNNDNFSPNDQWLVYDTRTTEGGIGANATIEKINIETGEKVVLYHLSQNTVYGLGVGAASYAHKHNQVIFIHGLFNCNKNTPYEQWRRTGVIVKDNHPGTPIFMDARDTNHPFTAGALRGGTHRHEWSADDRWIGFTYNDAVMKKLEDQTGIHQNLRTIGVSKRHRPISPDNTKPGEQVSAEWFSVLVAQVTVNPRPGSDDISNAAGDSWIGKSGYKKPDGTRQMARGFIGTVKNNEGKDIDEVFVVNIPENIHIPGDNGPLEGTETTMPSPPQGAYQQRLTYTAATDFPGCQGIVRSAFDGSMLSFTAFDKNNIKQVFTISPLGGSPVQRTFHASHVQGSVRWHPSKYRFCYVWQNALVSVHIEKNETLMLTRPGEYPPTNLVWSHDGKKIAYNKIVAHKTSTAVKQIFIIHI
ncbi:DUF3748 domain-containing protein [Arenibacter nanhaiticus]|nr:DUF3748 domain-containing protein [Arenibacter nanhaiticus]